MDNVDWLISKFIKDEISLAKPDILCSAKSRNWLLRRIQSKIQSKPSAIQLYSSSPFINFGSYFKGTKVRIVDEYDILVQLNTHKVNYNTNKLKGTGQGSDLNPLNNGKYNLENSKGISSTKVLNWLKSITQEIVTSFNGITPIRNGQAITATIKSSNIKIDLVPTLVFQDDASSNVFYTIPSGKDGGWMVINPRKGTKLLQYFSKSRSNYKNMIRIIKFIRDKYNMDISSFAIECCVWYYANSNTWANDSKNVVKILNYFQSCLRSIRNFLIHMETNNTVNLKWNRHLWQSIKDFTCIYKYNDLIKYIGRVKGNFDFYQRINIGYSNISPKNCYKDGQATNCHINAIINKLGDQVRLYVMPLYDYEEICSLEKKLIESYKPEWNTALK